MEEKKEKKEKRNKMEIKKEKFRGELTSYEVFDYYLLILLFVLITVSDIVIITNHLLDSI